MGFLPSWLKISRRRFVAVALTTTLAATVLLLITFLFLKSPIVQRKIIASIREPLARAGVQLELDQLSVDIFAGFNLVNLKLKIDHPPSLSANLSVQRARLKYKFWELLTQRLELSKATFQGIHGQISLTLPETEATDAPPMTLKQALSLLRNPPVTISIPAVEISDVKLDLKLSQGTKTTQLDISESDVSATFKLLPRELEIRLQASLDAGATIRNQPQKTGNAGNNSNAVSIDLKKIKLKPDLTISVLTPNDNLNLNAEIKPTPVTLIGLSTSFKDSTNSSLEIDLESLATTPGLKLEKSGSVSPDLNWSDLISAVKTSGEIPLTLKGFKLQKQDRSAGKSEKTKLSLDSFKTSSDWAINLTRHIRDLKHDWKIKHETSLKNLKFSIPGLDAASISGLTLTAGTNSQDGKGTARVDIGLEHANAKILQKTVSGQQDASVQFDLPSGNWSGKSQTSVNGSKILTWAGESKEEGNLLDHHSKLTLAISSAISNLHDGLKPLGHLGWPEIRTELKAQISHPQPWSEFKIEDWPKLDIHLQAESSVYPTAPQQQDQKIIFKSLNFATSAKIPVRPANHPESEVTVEAKVQVDELDSSALNHPVTITSNNTAKFRISEQIQGTMSHSSQVNNMKLMTMEASVKDTPRVLILDHSVVAELTPKIVQLFKKTGSIPTFGALKLTGEHHIKIDHPGNSVTDTKNLKAEKIILDAELTHSLTQNVTSEKDTEIVLKKPIALKTTVDLKKSALSTKTILDNTSVSLRGKASATDLQGALTSAVDNISAINTAAMNAEFGVKSIEVFEELLPGKTLDRFLHDLNFKLRAQLTNKTDIKVDTIEGGLENEMIRFKGRGEFHTSGRGQIDGEISSRLIEKESVIAGSGQFKAPVKIILFDKQRLSVEATPTFDSFTLHSGDFSVVNVNGTIKILEELNLDGDGKIGFLYLKSQNPFARVDYETVEPYVEDRALLSFDKLNWKHITVGPMVQSFEIRQNLILLNDLKMDLLDGSILGRFYADLHPSRLKTGFLGRFSGLHPELLKPPARRSNPSDWAVLGGRMALDFDIRKRLATGRMDFTSIGKRQLISILDALDPDFKDDQIALARQGLRIAYPRTVGVMMDHGMMDLNVSLGGALREDISVRSLPLSGLINSNVGETLGKIESIIN